MAMVASRRRLTSVVWAAAVLLVAAAAWWQATPAHADDATVIVESTDSGGRYVAPEVTIAPQESVTWVWEGDDHSVTHDPDEGFRLFDSHPACEDRDLLPNGCSEAGDENFQVVFEDEGTYRYSCRIHGDAMTGTVVVTEDTEEPSPTPSPSSTSPSPTGDVESSPTATSEPEPSSEAPSTREPAPEPEPEPEPAAPPPDPAPQQRVAAPQPVERTSASDAPTARAPAVASDDASPSPVPAPSFEEFPSASEPTGDAEVEGEVALEGSDDGGGTARTVWAVVGGASVLGTLGAFGRTVLFSDAWNG